MSQAPPPTPKDVQDFQFRLQSKLKIFEFESDSVLYDPTNLITTSSRYGLVFIGTPQSNFQVIKLKDIESFTNREVGGQDYLRRTVNLPSKPSHVQVNCDDTLLAVVFEDNQCAAAALYKVTSFFSQNIVKIKDLRLSSKPGVKILSTCWNPTIPGLFTVCKSDGSLSLYELKDTGIELHELPPDAKATAMCWSPKGKQIVVGTQNGHLIQYKPDLKAVKAIDPPPLGIPHIVLSIQWLSNYQFAVVYQPTDKSNSGNLIIVDAPKTGNIVYTNFEDICYSSSTAQQNQFYLEHLSLWGTLIVASANSIEVGVLGSENDVWTQWVQDDSSRCDLPLGINKEDTLPVGLSITTGTTMVLKKNAKSEDTIPPAPMLLLLSNHGLLCCFNIINLLPGIPQICSAPEQLPDQSGINQFIKPSNVPAPASMPSENYKSTQIQSTVAPTMLQPQLSSKPQGPTPLPTFVAQSQTTTSKSLFSSSTTILNAQLPASAPTSAVSNLIPPSTQVIVQPQKTQENISVSPPKVVSVKSSLEDVATKNIKTTLLINSIKEECSNFQCELNEVLERSRKIKVELGTDNEHIDMIKLADDLTKFQLELRDTTTSQAAEIHYLKQSLMQSFAWCEDARSRHMRFKDPSLNSLMRAQELDPVNQARLAELNHLLYYLDSQLRQVDNTLDEQWSLFQDSCKKTMKLQIPTLETIYQSMVRQNAIIMKQNFILKDIAARMKNTKKRKNHVSLITALSSKVEDVLGDLKQLQIEPVDIMQGKYDRIVAEEQRFDLKKQEKLRNFFSNRNVQYISTTKPCLSSSILNISPTRSMKKTHPVFSSTALNTPNVKKNLFPDISSLENSTDGVQLSPLQKPFVLPQSTPKQSENQFKPVPQKEKTSSNIPSVKMPSTQPLSFTNVKTSTFAAVTQPQLFQQPTSFINSSGTSKSVVTTSATSSMFKFSAQGMTISTPQVNFTTKQPELKQEKSAILAALQSKPSITTTTANLFSFGAAKPVNEIKQDSSTPASVSIFKVTEASKVTGTPSTGITAISPKPATSVPAGSLIIQPSVSSAAEVKTTESKAPFLTATGLTSLFKASPQTSFAFGTSSGGSAFAPLTSGLFSNTSANSTFSSAKPLGTISPSTAPLIPTTNSTTVTTASQSLVQTKSALFNFSNTPTTTSVSTLSAPVITQTPKAATTISVLSPGNSFTFGTVVKPASPSSGATIDEVPKTIVTTTSNENTKPVLDLSAKTLVTPALITPVTSAIATSSDNAVSKVAPITSTTAVSPTLTPTTKGGVLFGTTAATGTSQPSTPFGQTQTSTDAKATSAPSIFSSAVPTSTFGTIGSTASTTAASNIFVGGTATSTQKPIFGTQTSTSAPIFETNAVTTTASNSVFESTSSAANVFGSTPSASTTNSIFGGAVATPAAPTNIFAGAAPTSTVGTSAPTVFGSAPSSPTNIFGSPATSTQQTISDPSNIFGASTTSATATNVFGGASPTTTASNVFGGATSTNIFGGAAQSPTTNVFGSATPTSATANVFGSSTPSTTSGTVFGSPIAATAIATQSNIFGGSATVTTQSNVFGGAPAFGSASPSGGSIFGQSASKPAAFGSGGSIFGGAPAFGTSTTTSSPFGATSGNIFAGASQTTTTTASNIFGGAASTTSTFGTNSNVFGSKPAETTTTGFGFGFSSPAKNESSVSFGNLSVSALSPNSTPASTTASTFGAFPSNAQQNPFAKTTSTSTFMGQNICSPFGSTAPSSGGSIFGSPATTSASTSIFGGSSSAFGSSNTSGGFGSPPAFGSGNIFGQQQSTFGQQSAFGSPSGFGSANSGNTFGATQSPQSPSGNFSMGGQGVGQTGFGGFQKPAATGFGAAPVFGSPSPTGFGAPASFGGAPTFGTPPKVFGSPASPNTSFGSPTAENQTFANLASQSTLGFGSLAQSQAQKPAAAPSFSGGSSFSSWR